MPRITFAPHSIRLAMLVLLFLLALCSANFFSNPVVVQVAQDVNVVLDDAIKLALEATITEVPVVGLIIDGIFGFMNNWLGSGGSSCDANCVWSLIQTRVERAAIDTQLKTWWSEVQTNMCEMNNTMGQVARNYTCLTPTYCPGAPTTYIFSARENAKAANSALFSYLNTILGNTPVSCSVLDSMGMVAMTHMIMMRTQYNLSAQLNDVNDLTSLRLDMPLRYNLWMRYVEECYCNSSRSPIVEGMTCDSGTYLSYRRNHLSQQDRDQEACVFDSVDNEYICTSNYGFLADWIIPNTITARMNEIRTNLVSTLYPFMASAPLVLGSEDVALRVPNWYNSFNSVTYICVSEARFCDQVYSGPGVGLGPYGTGKGRLFGNQQGNNKPGTGFVMDPAGSSRLSNAVSLIWQNQLVGIVIEWLQQGNIILGHLFTPTDRLNEFSRQGNVNFGARPIRWVEYVSEETLFYWDYVSQITFGRDYGPLVVGQALSNSEFTTIKNNVSVGSTKFQLINTGFAPVSADGGDIRPGRPAPLLGNYFAVFEMDAILAQNYAADICDMTADYASCNQTRKCCFSRQRCARHASGCSGSAVEDFKCIPA